MINKPFAVLHEIHSGKMKTNRIVAVSKSAQFELFHFHILKTFGKWFLSLKKMIQIAHISVFLIYILISQSQANSNSLV